MSFTLNDKYQFTLPKTGLWYVELDKDDVKHGLGAYFEEENNLKKFNEWFTDEEAALVEGMILFIDRCSIKQKTSVYQRFKNLSKFSQLKFLIVPLDAVGHIDMRSIAPQLKELNISNPRISYEFFKKENYPEIFEETLPNLKILNLLCSPALFKNFSADRYPSLEWLHCELDFDKSGKFFSYFNQSKKMQGYELDTVLKKDLLKNVPKNITGLKFWSITTRSFDFSLLSDFKDLKYLEIAASFTPIDCSVFLDIPNLTELCLRISKNLMNTRALLDSKTLKKLKFSSNDKTDLSEETKQAMQQKFDEFKWE